MSFIRCPSLGKDAMNSPPLKRTRRLPGLTLIELLVSVSVIAILLSILLGALGRARETAKMAGCKQNQKTMYLGLFMYDDAYGRLPNTHLAVETRQMPPTGWWCTDPRRIHEIGPQFPGNYHPGPSSVDETCDGRMWFWQQQAAKMMGQGPEVMSCPSSRITKPDDTANPNQRYCGHFGSGVSLMRNPPAVACRTEPQGQVRWDQQRWQPKNVSMKLNEVRHQASVGLLWDSGQGFLSHDQAKYPRGFAWYIPGYWNNRNGPFDDAGAPASTQTAIMKGFESDAYDGRHPNKRLGIVYADGHGGEIQADILVDGRGSTPEAQERAWRMIWYQEMKWLDDHSHPR